jgi:hypothetical protein
MTGGEQGGSAVSASVKETLVGRIELVHDPDASEFIAEHAADFETWSTGLLAHVSDSDFEVLATEPKIVRALLHTEAFSPTTLFVRTTVDGTAVTTPLDAAALDSQTVERVDALLAVIGTVPCREITLGGTTFAEMLSR